jgi:colanic acid/amylovoran biosynthesis protein
MMGINILYYLSEYLKGKDIEDIEFYTDSSSQKELDLLIETSGYTKTYMKKKYNYDTDQKSNFIPIKKIKTLINILDQAKRDSKEYDYHIVLGGDDLSEYYGIKRALTEALKWYVESKKMSVFLTGQTIGPFFSYRKILIPLLIRNTYLYSRDDKTYLYAKNELKLKKVYNSRDLAFLDLPEQKNTQAEEALLKDFNIKKNQYITIVPSGLSGLYTQNFKKYIENYLGIIKSLIGNRKLRNMQIVLLSHVTEPDVNNDRKIVKEIVENLEEECFERIVTVDKKVLPHEARWILGNGLFTITGRMHAAVSAFQMGKPAIALSYSVKYEGVIGQGLDMNKLIIESANEQIWAKGEMINLTLSKIDYIMDNYEIISKRIREKVKDCKEKALLMVHDIGDTIVSDKGKIK